MNWTKEAAAHKQDIYLLGSKLKTGLYYGSRRIGLETIRQMAVAYKLCLRKAIDQKNLADLQYHYALTK